MNMTKKEFAAFAGPSIIVMFVLMIIPLLYTIYISFMAYTFGGTPRFIGFDNYITIFSNARFWSANWFAIFITLLATPIKIILGFTVALTLYKWESRVFKTIFISGSLLPFIVAPVVGTMAFSWLFKDNWGLVTYYLSQIGINFSWFGSNLGSQALIIMHTIWMGVAFDFLTLYAGLQAMPEEPLKAATVEGASGWQKIRYVIAPYLKPLIVFIAMVSVMDLYRLFDSVAVMTRGGPGTATETVQLLNYRLAFAQNNLGQAGAMSILTVIFIFLLMSPFLYMNYKEHKEANEGS